MPIADLLSVALRIPQTPRSLRDFLAPNVEKAFLENLNTGQNQEFLINPPEFTESYEAKYKRHGSLGLSSERLQFVGNPNAKISMEVMLDDLIERTRKSPVAGSVTEAGSATRHTSAPNAVEVWRRFLLSLIYPRRGRGILTGSPPAVLFYWPGMISMRVRIMKVSFRHILFQSGRPEPRVYMAMIEMEEDAQERIFSRDILNTGTIRPWGAGVGPRRG